MANYALAIRFKSEPLRSLPFSSMSGSYSLIGTYFDHPIRLVHIQNATNQPLTFSFDGIQDDIFLPAGGFLLLDLVANSTQTQGWFIAEGTGIYANYTGVAPSSGAAVVSAFYGDTGY